MQELDKCKNLSELLLESAKLASNLEKRLNVMENTLRAMGQDMFPKKQEQKVADKYKGITFTTDEVAASVGLRTSVLNYFLVTQRILYQIATTPAIIYKIHSEYAKDGVYVKVVDFDNSTVMYEWTSHGVYFIYDRLVEARVIDSIPSEKEMDLVADKAQNRKAKELYGKIDKVQGKGGKRSE